MLSSITQTQLFSRAVFIIALLMGCIWITFSINTFRHDLINHTDDAISHDAAITHQTVSATYLPLAEVQALNLFGRIRTLPSIDTANLPETPLRLKLAGLFVSSLNGNSRAVISDDGKPAKTYFVGDNLPGGATLQGIDNDAAIIQHGERLEKLPLHNASIETTALPHHSSMPSQFAQAAATVAPVTIPDSAPVRQAESLEGIHKELENRLAAIHLSPK